MAKKIQCNNMSCRVDKFYIGDWSGYEYEDSTAWSGLEPNWCPACSEEGEIIDD